jgi:ribosomal protein L32
VNLIQCVTCGASSITNGKCDYCGNHYETETIFEEQKEQETTYTELRFQDTHAGKLILKIMIYTLVSIVWFAVTVFIQPLFIITIILLVVYSTFRLTIKKK